MGLYLKLQALTERIPVAKVNSQCVFIYSACFKRKKNNVKYLYLTLKYFRYVRANMKKKAKLILVASFFIFSSVHKNMTVK